MLKSSMTAAMTVCLLASASFAAGTVDSKQPWSARMAESVMIRHPKGVSMDSKLTWSYSTSFCVRAVTEVGIAKGATGDGAPFLRWGRDYLDTFINNDGVIGPAYDFKGHRLDDIEPGELVLTMYAQTKDEKYKKAALQLAEQFKSQPRVEGGGFWHKDIYPNQMWVDGIFMGCPFMAKFGATTGQPQYFDEVANQILLLASHAQDPATGLMYHGWDASKKEKWADPKTGLSQCFWGRGMGWYLAGIVDALDDMPANHPRRAEIIAVLRKGVAGLEKVQDPKTGLWWQVLDQGNRAGNYLESSASSMFVYVLAKASRNGTIDAHYADVAKKGYEGIIAKLIDVDATTGLVTLKDTCQVAGLGANPYRDGSYEYYLREPRVSNDTKGIAPFILASLELERSH